MKKRAWRFLWISLAGILIFYLWAFLILYRKSFLISYENMDGNEKLSGCVGKSGILDGNEEYMLLSGGQHSGFASAVSFCGAYTPEKQYREQDR